VREVAKAAAECGIQEFIIDDGWEYNYGRKSSARDGVRTMATGLSTLTSFPVHSRRRLIISDPWG